MDTLKTIKEKALEEHIPILMDDTLEVIIDILKKEKPKKLLEIGTAVGYSAICFAQNMEDDSCIDTIELDENRAKEAMDNFKKLNLDGRIHLYQGNAVEILPTLQDEYDVIFIDAAKGKYPIFLQEAIRLLKNGGVILADNVLYKGYVLSDYNKHKQRTAVKHVREYLKEVHENPALDTTLLEVGDGLAITRVNK